MELDYIAIGIKMLGVLVLMIGVLAALNHYSRRLINRGRGGVRSKISVIESTMLGGKHRIAMVKVPGSVLVLGISSDQMTLLEKIPEAMVEDEQDMADGRRPHPFHTQLGRMMKRLSTITDRSQGEGTAPGTVGK